ncbi:MAG: energy transducer TonB [Muribaculaceae bacterium]|nr:energy transducer TonB [Muribaculaceae bacterium]MDE6009187.1 energy transducer TonB [Muribaculaceae bacterium]MDE6791978.1 energy transducer TonB [Muribaculaceae bacterium]
MAKRNVDLTSKEWRDMVFEGKQKEFGAYELRKKSDRRHNLAVLYTLIGLVVVVIGLIAWSKYSDYRAEQAAIALAQEREKMAAAELLQDDKNDEPEPEPEVEEQKFEQEIPEVPQEVLATVQVTQIAIVDADKVKNEVMDMETQKEDNTARGVVNQEGSDDADKFKAVQEQVIVKEPEPEVKPKEEEIFVAVEQPAEFPGGQAAMYKWLSNNMRYPEAAQQNDIQGTVHVKFVVEKDGSIGTVTLLKGVDKDLDREALRVVKKMPKWQPGKNNGVAVRSYFTLPVKFRLQQQ